VCDVCHTRVKGVTCLSLFVTQQASDLRRIAGFVVERFLIGTDLRAMTHRSIRDRDGRVWDIWETHPDVAPSSSFGDEEDSMSIFVPITVPSGLSGGWLVFVSGTERRRLAPIPPNWEFFAASELRDLLDRAVTPPSLRRPLFAPPPPPDR
jgi:hypothetical protein